MPLKIVEKSLDNVRPEHRDLYVQQRDGAFKLDLPDLDKYVADRLSPIETELKVSRENELKLGLTSALRKAGVSAGYEDLVLSKYGSRVTLDTTDDQRVIRILSADGEMPLVGATLDSLAREAARKFPSAFKGNHHGGPSIKRKSEFKNEKERAKFVNEHGFDAYKALPD